MKSHQIRISVTVVVILVNQNALRAEHAPASAAKPPTSFDFDQHFDKELQKRLNNSEQEKTVPNLAREYSTVRRELLVLEKIATELTVRIKRLDVEVGMPPRIELVQRATIDE